MHEVQVEDYTFAVYYRDTNGTMHSERHTFNDQTRESMTETFEVICGIVRKRNDKFRVTKLECVSNLGTMILSQEF